MKLIIYFLSVLGVMFSVVGCNDTPSPQKKVHIDYADYLPQKSMIKRYKVFSTAPWLKGEGVSESSVKIERNLNTLTYRDNTPSENDIVLESRLKIDTFYIVEYLGDFKSVKTKRELLVNDISSINVYDKSIEDSCTFKGLLKEFSHNGYSYQGEIMHEQCTHVFLSKKAIDTYDKYTQKGLGEIAVINDSCYRDSNRYPTDKEGCHVNGHSHRYYIK